MRALTITNPWAVFGDPIKGMLGLWELPSEYKLTVPR